MSDVRSAARLRVLVGLAACAVTASTSGCRCGRTGDGDPTSGGAALNEPPIVETTGSRNPAGAHGAFSAPIAASRIANGEVLVAGLDASAKVIRVLRVGSNDVLLGQGTAFEGVKWTSDSDLKLVRTAGDGAAITWRGLREGKAGRSLVIVGSDLKPKGAPVEVGSASCATRDAIWSTDGRTARGHSWNGSVLDVELPKDREASLSCGTSGAFALLEEEDGTSLMRLGAVEGGRVAPMMLLRDSDFGDDEQRERAEYTVGDDIGVVRLASSGTLSVREVKDGVIGALRRLRTKIPHDDDVVAVDASSKVLVIVFTEDASSRCADGQAAMNVSALRVDRTTGGETTHALSEGVCTREVGPFFTGALADAVSVAWVERVPAAGKAKAPIVALAHAVVRPTGTPAAEQRMDVAADAVVDAGCDEAHCYAAALERRVGTDGMAPGGIRVLRYR